MRTLDETDAQILSILADNARQPYSEIADQVDLSPPAVSERIDRLQESGVIRRFTLDIDRSQLRSGVPVLVELSLNPGVLDDARASIRSAEAVEHIFTTAGNDILFSAHLEPSSVRETVLELVDSNHIRDYDVRLLSETEWEPNIGGTEFALTCAECGNTVTDEGVVTRLDETVYHFCCPSCEARFTDTYEDIRQAAHSDRV